VTQARRDVDLTSPPDTGAQPLVSQDGKTILTVNGEIYNHLSLRANLESDVKFKTHSDCEVILPLVCQRYPISTV
jgi:asparagine synthetase B (glutamine-hydrolysing)